MTRIEKLIQIADGLKTMNITSGVLLDRVEHELRNDKRLEAHFTLQFVDRIREAADDEDTTSAH